MVKIAFEQDERIQVDFPQIGVGDGFSITDVLYLRTETRAFCSQGGNSININAYCPSDGRLVFFDDTDSVFRVDAKITASCWWKVPQG